MSTGLPEVDYEARQRRARFRLENLKRIILNFRPTTSGLVRTSRKCARPPETNFTRDGYMRAVQRARQYIIDGDIFEVNLSQRFEAPIGVSPHVLYSRLRTINPAPFASYLGFDEVQIVGASPERFLRKRGNAVETRPIKGTRRRGVTREEDAQLAAELMSSAKDHAENMMIVDLEETTWGVFASMAQSELLNLPFSNRIPLFFT